MKKILMFLILLAVAVPCLSYPRAANDRTTFRNGYAWSGHTRKDRATQWAQGIEGAAELGGGLGTGSIWYVDSGVTSAGSGKSWTGAVATLDAIFALITADGGASRGDYVFVAEGHNEALTVADAVDADVIGVTIIGKGYGSLRPTFDYDAVAGEFVIGADDITLINLRFRASVAKVLTAVDIEDGSDYTNVIGCDFLAETPDTDYFTDSVINRNNANDTLIQSCTFTMGTTTASSAILLDADTDNTVIRGNFIKGDYGGGCIEGATTASEFLLIENNILWNGDVSALHTVPAIALVASSSGIVRSNYIAANLSTVAASLSIGDCFEFDNWYNEDSGGTKAAVPWSKANLSATFGSVSVSSDG